MMNLDAVFDAEQAAQRVNGRNLYGCALAAIETVADAPLRADLRYDLEERIGIGIFDLSMSPEDAERIAAGEILKRIADMKGRPP